MFENWRFLELTAPIREVYATEEALAESLEEGPVLMIWRAKPHAISLPVQKEEKEINKDVCTLLGAEWTRRNTQGEIFYHNHLTDFSYSMIVPLGEDIEATKQELLSIVKGALRYLGVPASIDGDHITVDGKKISESSFYIKAGPDGSKSLVLHGFVLYELPSFLTGYQMIRSQKSVERRARESMETHAAINDYVNTSFSQVVNAFLENTRSTKMFLRNYERKRIQEILDNKYNNDNWQTNGHWMNT